MFKGLKVLSVIRAMALIAVLMLPLSAFSGDGVLPDIPVGPCNASDAGKTIKVGDRYIKCPDKSKDDGAGGTGGSPGAGASGSSGSGSGSGSGGGTGSGGGAGSGGKSGGVGSPGSGSGGGVQGSGGDSGSGTGAGSSGGGAPGGSSTPKPKPEPEDPERKAEDEAVMRLINSWTKHVQDQRERIAKAKKDYAELVDYYIRVYTGVSLANMLDKAKRNYEALIKSIEKRIVELDKYYSEKIRELRKGTKKGSKPTDPGHGTGGDGGSDGANGSNGSNGNNGSSGSSFGAGSGGKSSGVGSSGSGSGGSGSGGGVQGSGGGGSGSGTGTGSSGGGNDAAGKDGKDGEGMGEFCKKNPNALACTAFDKLKSLLSGSDKEGGEGNADVEIKVPVKEDGRSWSPTRFLPSNGTCPADKTFQVAGHSFKISFENICKFLAMIRPMVIAACMFFSGLMIFNSLRGN